MWFLVFLCVLAIAACWLDYEGFLYDEQRLIEAIQNDNDPAP